MAKKGDHVLTTEGEGTVIHNRMVAMHGQTELKDVMCEAGKVQMMDVKILPIKPGFIIKVIKTKEQLAVEEYERSLRIWEAIENGGKF